MYSLDGGECLLSEPAHSSAVSGLSVVPGLAGGPTRVITADSEGSIKIFAIKQSDQETKLGLSCVFVSEREEKRRAITSIYNSGKKFFHLHIACQLVEHEHALQSCLQSFSF